MVRLFIKSASRKGFFPSFYVAFNKAGTPSFKQVMNVTKIAANALFFCTRNQKTNNKNNLP
jgi:hypothetical protein